MRFSIWPGSGTKWEDMVDLCEHAEQSGWDGLWVADHFMPDGDDSNRPVGEVWTLLAALAARVPRLRLGSLVVGNTYRHPPVLAKQVAQVDNISGGRVILGIGGAWQQTEHEAYGIPFYSVGGRLRRLEEAVQIIRSLFDNDRTTFEGRYYQVKDAPLSPKPVQSHLPIMVGGGGEQVTLRIAAQYADEWNWWGTPRWMAQKGQVLERHLADLGRDPAEIKRSASTLMVLSDDEQVLKRAHDERERGERPMIIGNVERMQEIMQQYVDARVDELILPASGLGGDVEQQKATYDRFIEEVAPAFR